MKLLLLIGGFSGFVCGTAFSLLQQETWPVCLWHGVLAAIIASALLPWWNRAWARHEHDMTEAKSTSDSLITASNTANTSKT